MNSANRTRTLRRALSHPLLLALLRVALGLVFIVASLDKIQNPEAFASTIANYRFLPYKTINGVAIVLPWLEAVAGTLLVFGVWVRANTLIICCLLVAFSIAIAQALGRGLDISCGCFNTNPVAEKMSLWTLIWDLIWLCWGGLLWAFDRGHYSVLSFSPGKKDSINSL
jgi:uncharacterized membrane protein YphA (DoxX/SURF4 family)